MLVSYNWINEFINTGLSPKDMADSLTMAGLEIEGMEKSGDDHILEVNVTPNRPDCLSVLGIARELAAITGKKIKLPPHKVKDKGPSEFKLEIVEPSLCHRYAGRVIRGVKIGRSPDWMSRRLEACGIRSINNVVDITNYVLLEFGHPLHAFDLGTLRKSMIRVGTAGKGMKFQTLDGTDRRMPQEALMIMDGEGPVAVAGVMGGAVTEVSDRTADVFLESAYFAPSSIRKTSKSLGLSTESSYRFERGTDIVMLENAMDRAAMLMAEHAGGTVHAKVDKWPTKAMPAKVKTRPARINRVLGTNIPKGRILGMLRRLGFGTTEKGSSIMVTPPPFRPDITMEEDIIEEVARLHGYGNIPTAMPLAGIEPTPGVDTGALRAAKEVLTVHGYSEAVNYSFMNVTGLDTLGIGDKDQRRKCVKVMNPLRSEDEHLRTTLVLSLLENTAHNLAHGSREVRLFESASVFIDDGGELPREPMRLGAVLIAGSGPALYPETAETFYLLKGTLEALIERLRVGEFSFETSEEPFLHPGKSADLIAAGKKAGYIGVVSPEVVSRMCIKTRSEIAVFELDIDALACAQKARPRHDTLPRFPAVERDVALVLEMSVRSADVLEAIRLQGSEFIEEASVFDLYEGKGVPEGKKSLAFNIRYRAKDRTLTDEEVDNMHSALVKGLVEKTGGSVRGR